MSCVEVEAKVVAALRYCASILCLAIECAAAATREPLVLLEWNGVAQGKSKQKGREEISSLRRVFFPQLQAAQSGGLKPPARLGAARPPFLQAAAQPAAPQLLAAAQNSDAQSLVAQPSGCATLHHKLAPTAQRTHAHLALFACSAAHFWSRPLASRALQVRV